MTGLPPGFALWRGWASDHEADWPHLLGECCLEQREVVVFGKRLLLPRLTAWYGEAAYSYSGQTHAPAEMPAWIASMRRALELQTGARYNSVLLNFYRDGSDSVAWHADDEPELGTEPTIASVSLGARRRFAVKARGRLHGTPLDPTWEVDLGAGDLLVMSGRSQLDYLHSVPKTRRPVGPRLNLTFRRVRADGERP